MIRAAGPGDAEAIARLGNWMIRTTTWTFTTIEKTQADVAQMIATRPGAFWVAQEGADCAGFITFGTFRSGPGYAATVEHSILVSPEFQGRGLGRALMEAGFEAARAAGCHVMVGGISGSNPNGLSFHARMGFDEVGRMPQVGRKNGKWLDLVLMQKIL